MFYVMGIFAVYVSFKSLGKFKFDLNCAIPLVSYIHYGRTIFRPFWFLINTIITVHNIVAER